MSCFCQKERGEWLSGDTVEINKQQLELLIFNRFFLLSRKSLGGKWGKWSESEKKKLKEWHNGIEISWSSVKLSQSNPGICKYCLKQVVVCFFAFTMYIDLFVLLIDCLMLLFLYINPLRLCSFVTKNCSFSLSLLVIIIQLHLPLWLKEEKLQR